MEAIIRVKPSELKMELLERISRLVEHNEDSDIFIHVMQTNASDTTEKNPADYYAKLTRSISEMEEGKTTSFTMDELRTYIEHNFSS